MTFNKDQYLQVAAPFLAFAGGLVVGKGWLTDDQWGKIANFALENGPIIIPFVIAAFAWVKNKFSTKAVEANNIPGVQVTVNPVEAPKEVVAVALEPTNTIKVES